MDSKLLNTCAALLLLSLSSVVNAASISLAYTGFGSLDNNGALIATPGDLVTFDIWIDFTDNPTAGGGFDLFFNSNAITLNSFERFCTCTDPDCCGWRDPAFSTA